MKFNVGVIGGGMVSWVHLEALAEHPAVGEISLAESDPVARERASKQFRLRDCVSDYRLLLESKDIDLVDICLPHDLHYPVTLEAFALGKHVILEKPISNTLPEADAMIAAAQQSGKRFYVALNERYLPVHRRVKDLLAGGAIGRPIMASLSIAGNELERMQQPDNWKGTFGRAGGGALADSGTHLVDLALDWFGMPEAVMCTLGRYVVQAVNKADDTATLVLIYPDKTVNLYLTYVAAGQPWSERRHVWGERGSIHVQVEADEPIQVWQQGKQVPQAIEHEAANWWAYSVKLGLNAALDCLQGDMPFPVTPQDAREVLQVIRAAYLSARLKRQVELSEAGRDNSRWG